MNERRNLVLVAVLVAATVTACTGTEPAGPAASAAPQEASRAPGTMSTKRSEGGQVTVVATWPGPAAGATFDLKLDTHSVDLDALDLSNAILRNDRGESLLTRGWTAPNGGHHREGALQFDGDVSRFLAGARWIELILTGVGDVPERALRWEIGS